MVVVVCSVTVDSSWNARYNTWSFICTVFFTCVCFYAILVCFSLIRPPIPEGLVLNRHVCNAVRWIANILHPMVVKVWVTKVSKKEIVICGCFLSSFSSFYKAKMNSNGVVATATMKGVK